MKRKDLVVVVVLFLLTIGAICKECIFLHGTGVRTNEPPSSSFPDYWGNVQAYTTQCEKNTFIHTDTVNYPFDDPKLMKEYCSLCTDQFKNTNEKGIGMINNKIVFTHSMGNNILAAAIQHKICDFDLETSSWYEIAAPLRGTKATSFLEPICEGKESAALTWLAITLNYCVDGHMSPAHKSLRPDYPGLDGLDKIAAERISGALCGINAFGLVSSYSVPMQALSALVNYGEPNDGMVPIFSCNVTGQFGGSYTDAFYAGRLNHADTTCRNGGVPCNWFGARK